MNKPFLREKDRALWEAFQDVLGGKSTEFRDVLHADENHVSYALFSDSVYHRQFVARLTELVSTLDGAGISYLLIKTEKRYPYDDSNIDVLLETEKDFQSARALAQANGRRCTKSYHEPDKEMWRLFQSGKEEHPGWHLHRAVSWNGVPYLDQRIVFDRARAVVWEGVSFRVPGTEHDLLIHAAHTAFENFQVTLGELYDACERSGEVRDWDATFREAEQNGWCFAYKMFLSTVRTFGRVTNTPHAVPETISEWRTTLRFPIRYPMVFQLWAFSERILHNLKTGNLRHAFRELYAYPAFYLIEKFKHLTYIRYP